MRSFVCPLEGVVSPCSQHHNSPIRPFLSAQPELPHRNLNLKTWLCNSLSRPHSNITILCATIINMMLEKKRYACKCVLIITDRLPCLTNKLLLKYVRLIQIDYSTGLDIAVSCSILSDLQHKGFTDKYVCVCSCGACLDRLCNWGMRFFVFV